MGTQQESSLLRKGQLIGGCRAIRLIGRGGMGEVYLAEHISLQKHVALKILSSDLGREDCVERFLKEARTCSRIEHPNVIVIHDVGKQGDLHYIVMQHVQDRHALGRHTESARAQLRSVLVRAAHRFLIARSCNSILSQE